MYAKNQKKEEILRSKALQISLGFQCSDASVFAINSVFDKAPATGIRTVGIAWIEKQRLVGLAQRLEPVIREDEPFLTAYALAALESFQADETCKRILENVKSVPTVVSAKRYHMDQIVEERSREWW